MKSFGGFKESPVKAKKKTTGPDAVLIEAADFMSRGTLDPVSYGGSAITGFLKGFKLTQKNKQTGDDLEDRKKERAKKAKDKSDDWWYNDGKGRKGSDKDKRIKKKELNLDIDNIISIEDINKSNVDAIDPDIQNAKTRRNKRNRRRNKIKK